jgi:hypothetical protein
MNKLKLIACLLFIAFTARAQQKVIQLYNGTALGSEGWTYNEQQYNLAGNDPLTYNVSHPTLTEYAPDKSIANGTAVIICPAAVFTFLQ